MKEDDLKITAMASGYVVEVSGRANFDYAVPLRKLAEKIEPGNWLQFEMENCETMDSTFMGVLTMLALKLRKGDTQILLINASDQLHKLLRDLGVAKLFKFVSGEGKSSDASGTVLGMDGKATMLMTAQTVVDAHKTLIAADQRNQEKFNQVIEFAEQDVARLKEDENI